jgi:hypothetical protein
VGERAGGREGERGSESMFKRQRKGGGEGVRERGRVYFCVSFSHTLSLHTRNDSTALAPAACPVAADAKCIACAYVCI